MASKSLPHRSSPDFEHEIGIETFYTPTPGVGGHLRETPQDFRVSEVYQLPPAAEQGRFTLAEVTSTNWETHTLVQALADSLHIHPKRIAFAGTKDRRAVSTQLMSFDGVAVDFLSSILINDVVVKPLYHSIAPLHLGQLQGNKFEIVIRNCPPDVKDIQSIVAPLRVIGGFPNFFGIQRFGGVRSITHVVGKYLTQGDFENAVMTYVANPLPLENPEAFQLRKELAATHDFVAALQKYPRSLNFERMILERLAQDPKDFIKAIQALPKNLLLMFVNAYQSFLFNRMLSQRIMQGLPLDQAVPGDIVGVLKDGKLQDQFIQVSATNVEKVNTQIKRGKAAVTGLLVGCESQIGDGAMGEIEHRVIDKEKIETRSFIIPEVPFLSSSGSRRLLIAPIKDFHWIVSADNRNQGSTMISLTFELLKGCYATSFLREVMKAPQAADY